jgi:20S proteasome alpha/beta subunit
VPFLRTLIAGDPSNSARLFIDRYYSLSGKSLPEAVAIGVHAMRLAIGANPGVLGQAKVWIYQNKVFRQLSDTETAPYLRLSESVDKTILAEFRKASALSA